MSRPATPEPAPTARTATATGSPTTRDQVGFLNPNRDDAEAVAFFAQRTSDLAFGAPVIIRDPATGNFGLTIGIGESPNLGDPFTKRPITPAETSIIDGEIRLTIPAPGEAFFYRFYRLERRKLIWRRPTNRFREPGVAGRRLFFSRSIGSPANRKSVCEAAW
ncbi:MAG: hypothetical protein R3F11_31985 [Verrucomicrobiales bacterium]